MMKLLLIIVACLGSATALANDAPLSAFDLARPSTHSGIKLSPSGRYLALTQIVTAGECLDTHGRISRFNKNCDDDQRTYRGSYTIVIFDLQTNAAVSALPMPDDIYVQWLEWANEDRLLAALARRSTSNDRGTRFSFGGSRIVSIPREQGEYITLFENSRGISRSNFSMSSVTNLLRKDPDHVLVPAYQGGELDLWKVNVNTGEFERVAAGQPGTFYWYADNDGKPIFRFDANLHGTRVFVHAWSDERQRWEKIKTFNIRDEDEDDDFEFLPIAPTDVVNRIYVIADEDSDAHRAIKIYDLKSQSYVETVFEHEKYDVSGAIIDVATGKYAGAWYYGDRLQLAFLDKKMSAHFRGLNKFFGDAANVDFLGFSDSGSKAIVYVSAPDMPGEYFSYDFEGARLAPILASKPEIMNAAFGKTDIINVTTRDGAAITAYLTHPSDGPGATAPLIVMPHGGPESRDYFVYNPQVQFFATRGYRVLQVNFRGSSGYGRDFAKAGYGEWGGVMQNDVTDAVQVIFKSGIASPDKTCIVGYSYGGYVALYGAAATPELYRCVVSGGGASDLVDSLNETKREFGADSETYEYWMKSIGDPSVDKEKLALRSPIKYADKIKVPLLLIHGEDDRIENVDQSRRMNKALEQAGASVRYIELKAEGHRNWKLETNILYLVEIERFLAEHLK